MNKIKNIIFIISFQAIFCLSVLPYYIPSWEKLMIAISCLLQIPILFFAGRMIWQFKQENHPKTIIIGIGVFLEIILLFAVVAIFGFGQGIFGGYYVKSIPVQNERVTFYVYDNSFLDASAKVFVNNGFSPTMDFVYQQEVDAQQIYIQQKGDTIIFIDNRSYNPTKYNLKTKKVIHSKSVQ